MTVSLVKLKRHFTQSYYIQKPAEQMLSKTPITAYLSLLPPLPNYFILFGYGGLRCINRPLAANASSEEREHIAGYPKIKKAPLPRRERPPFIDMSQYKSS